MPIDKPLSSPTPPWRWSTLLAAPHRLGFFAAALVMSAAALWWWFEMASRWLGGGGLPWINAATHAVPPTFVHALVMSLGFLPLFFSGFLFTAGPRWLQMHEVPALTILRPVVALAAGWVLLIVGARLHHLLAAAGVALATLGWAALTRRFIDLVRRSPAPDRLHASIIAVAACAGVLAMAGAALALAMQQWAAVRVAALLGLWWFVVPVYVSVAHRMIPFFTASALPVLDAWRPNWLLWTLLGAVGLQGVWVLADATGVADALGPVGDGVRVLSSALLGSMVMALAVRWGLVQSLRIRLLAMLHLGFVWLGVMLVLDAAAVAAHALAGASLALLPLHALTMGFLGSVLLAMATRVSCGHGGRTLAADDLAWMLFWALQGAVVLRLVATLWVEASGWLLLAAASLWLLATGGWALRYGRWFGRPRLDGRPG